MYKVKIIQTLEGYVDIDANSAKEALAIAEKRYNVDGAQLPDMEDCSRLSFYVIPPAITKDKEMIIPGKLTAEDVERYLKAQGYPEPSQIQMEGFLDAGNDQDIYDEAVINNYDIVDLSRWIHLKNLFGEAISFGGAMMIDNALWVEGQECLEIKSVQELFETEKGICKNLIESLIDAFNADGTVVPNNYNVRDTDVAVLANAFNIPLSREVQSKDSLTAMIQDARERSEEQMNDPKNNTPILTPGR